MRQALPSRVPSPPAGLCQAPTYATYQTRVTRNISGKSLLLCTCRYNGGNNQQSYQPYHGNDFQSTGWNYTGHNSQSKVAFYENNQGQCGWTLLRSLCLTTSWCREAF
jgi:hypothetical protein